MKKNYTLHKFISLTLILSMVSVFTACGCGRSVDNNNSTSNTTSESGMINNHTTSETGMNNSESDMFNGSMGTTNDFNNTDGTVNSVTDGTDNGLVGGVVDDIVGGVDDLMNSTETTTEHTNNSTINRQR